MQALSLQLLLLLESLMFISVVSLHILHRYSSAIAAYIIQSGIIAVLLILSAIQHPSPLVFAAVIATIAVKLIVAPYFFFHLVRMLS